MGGEDGVPKTPEWAEAKCGIPARQIKALARHWAKHNVTIGHCNGGSYIRSCYAHEPARLEIALLTMQSLGKPGRNQLKFIEWGLYNQDDQNAAPRPEFHPSNGAVKQTSKGLLSNDPFIPKTLIPEAVYGGYTSDNPLTWYGTTQSGSPANDQFIQYRYPWKGEEPIHMIWSDTPCWETCWNEGNLFTKALRHPSIEFFMVQHPWMENDCLVADIILPVSTLFEQEDIMYDVCSGDYMMFYYEDEAVSPYGEALSDYHIVEEIAKKLGKVEAHTLGRTDYEWFKLGFEKSGIEDRMTWDEFMEKKYYICPTAEDWQDDPAGFIGFYEDPEGHPLSTPTGKIEFYSAYLAEYFPDDKERQPTPKWIETGVTHPSERLNTPRAEKYPFLLVSNHPRWRVHANMDDNPWLREIETCKVVGSDGYAYEPVWINPKDAEKLGVENGDVVKLYNERGWVLGGAYVTERIRESVVLQDHGARLDPIVRGESDRGGANNLIAPSATTSKNCAGEVTSGFLVGVERVDVFELAEQYPEAFSRKRDPEYGNIVEAWLA